MYRPFALAALLALLLCGLFPSSALMATVTVSPVCGADDGKVFVGFTYDDQTLSVLQLNVTNSGDPGTVTAQLFDQTGALITSLTRQINAGQPTAVLNLNPLNLTMVSVPGTGRATGTSSLQFPGVIQCQFTSGR